MLQSINHEDQRDTVRGINQESCCLIVRKSRGKNARGASTITQQLAKNLFLSGERTMVRKGQEFVLTFLLERLLTKRRILEIYLNSVEWGEGVFGAEAAAQRYFRKTAKSLSSTEAARLAYADRAEYLRRQPDVLTRLRAKEAVCAGVNYGY